MKKSIGLMFLAVVFQIGVLGGCTSNSSPVSLTPTPFPPTETLIPTNTPVPTETPTPIPLPQEPYAVISADMVYFWFPLPEQEVYEWDIPEKGGADFLWTIAIGDNQDYIKILVICGFPKSGTSQTGTIEEMINTCRKVIFTPDVPKGIPADDSLLFSITDKGLLIELTNSDLKNKLLEDKPQLILFSTMQSTKVTLSESSLDFSKNSAFIQSDKAEFWFKVPDKNEWTWNLPMEYIGMSSGSSRKSTSWDITFGNTIVISTSYWTDWKNKDNPTQTGSFEEFIKQSEKNLLIYRGDIQGNWETFDRNYDGFSTSITNGGLLMQLTSQDLVSILNEDPSQTIIFYETVPYEVIPTYK